MESMDRESVISTLRAHEAELRAKGVVSVSLFGSVARGEPHPQDVDLAVRLTDSFSKGGFDFIRQLDLLEGRLRQIFGCHVDVVEEPVRRQRFQDEIDRDRACAF
jgi:predicted nucleotidyltransferase